MSQSRLFSNSTPNHGQQIAHVRAWKREQAITVKKLWNAGVSVKEICTLVHISEDRVDHLVRGNIARGLGPVVTPRRSYGRGQKRQLRELMEVPG